MSLSCSGALVSPRVLHPQTMHRCLLSPCCTPGTARSWAVAVRQAQPLPWGNMDAGRSQMCP